MPSHPSIFSACPFTLFFKDCGNTFSNGGAPTPAGDCSMVCSGNSSEICGGPNRLNVYNYTGTGQSPTNPPPPPASNGPWVSLGCYRYSHPFFSLPVNYQHFPFCAISDKVGARTLSVPTNPIGGASNNSVESCTAACFAAGYPLAGMEYSAECCAYYLSPSFSSVAH